MATISEALAAAFDHHAAGRPAVAAEICARILAAVPDQADSRHLLGLLHAAAGNDRLAATLLRSAVALRPGAALFLINLAAVLDRAGAMGGAEAMLRRALRLDPSAADAHANRGRALRLLGRVDAAEAACTAALALAPAHPAAWANLADSQLAGNRAAAALRAAQRALAVRPGDAAALLVHGTAQGALGALENGTRSLRSAVASDPGRAEAWENLGALLAKAGRETAALAAFDAAQALRPGPGLDAARGAALIALGRPRAAVPALDRAMAARPDDAGLHWNRAFAQLLAGDWAAGWESFEWRRRDDRAAPPWRRFPQPVWTGEDPAGRTILLYAEQGLGDTIQFLRYVPLVAARGARVVLEVQPPLLRLARRVEGAATVLARGEALPGFDLECPLMSVPRAVGTTPDTVPAAVPYLRPEPERVAHWGGRIGPGGDLKVGLVWAGNPRFPGDRLRSPRLAPLAPVLAVPRVRFVGLQVGPGRDDLATVDLPPGFADLGAEVADFADTAAAMANLDLVVSSCTGPAHLAGALGVPLWVMLPFAPDWRWMLGRDDSPWYPTARLYRQRRVGDWSDVAARVAADLAALARR